jgi:hypothetical protein
VNAHSVVHPSEGTRLGATPTLRPDRCVPAVWPQHPCMRREWLRVKRVESKPATVVMLEADAAVDALAGAAVAAVLAPAMEELRYEQQRNDDNENDDLHARQPSQPPRSSPPLMTNESPSKPQPIAVITAITVEVPTGHSPIHVAHMPIRHRIG